MTMTNEVYTKIIEISSRAMNPRPKIMVPMLAQELLLTQDQILPCLTALKQLRLIKTEGFGFGCIKLTLLGSTVTR